MTNYLEDKSLMEDFLRSVWHACFSDPALEKQSSYTKPGEFSYYVGLCDEQKGSRTRILYPKQSDDTNSVIGASKTPHRRDEVMLEVSHLAHSDRITTLPTGPLGLICVYNATLNRRLHDGENDYAGLIELMKSIPVYPETKLLVVGVDNTSDLRSFAPVPFQGNALRQAAWENAVMPLFARRLLFPRPIDIAFGTEKERGLGWYKPFVVSKAAFTGLCSEDRFNCHDLKRCYFITFALLSHSQLLRKPQEQRQCLFPEDEANVNEAIYIPREITQYVLKLCSILTIEGSIHRLMVFLAETFLNDMYPEGT
jgi:hypothetical protein